MLDSTTIHMLVEGTGATLYMTLLSTFFGYVLGLPIGIILTITDKEGICCYTYRKTEADRRGI